MIVELNAGGVRSFSDGICEKVELLSPGHRDSQLIFKVALSASVLPAILPLVDWGAKVPRTCFEPCHSTTPLDG